METREELQVWQPKAENKPPNTARGETDGMVWFCNERKEKEMKGFHFWLGMEIYLYTFHLVSNFEVMR